MRDVRRAAARMLSPAASDTAPSSTMAIHENERATSPSACGEPTPASDTATALVPAVDADRPPSVRESLSVLPLKRQRLVMNFFTSGNLTQSVLDAGYHPKTKKRAYEQGQDVMSHPDVQRAFAALTESSFSLTKLREIHAAHLGRYASIDASDRDRSLRALSLAYEYLGARPGGATAAPGTDPAQELLAQMSSDELEAPPALLPERARPGRRDGPRGRCRAAGECGAWGYALGNASHTGPATHQRPGECASGTSARTRAVSVQESAGTDRRRGWGG
jgi:hypothetical protein